MNKPILYNKIYVFLKQYFNILANRLLADEQEHNTQIRK